MQRFLDGELPVISKDLLIVPPTFDGRLELRLVGTVLNVITVGNSLARRGRRRPDPNDSGIVRTFRHSVPIQPSGIGHGRGTLRSGGYESRRPDDQSAGQGS